jgi:hypothetical protein
MHRPCLTIPIEKLLEKIRFRTQQNRVKVEASLERARRLAGDEDRTKRLAEVLCSFCFYRGPTVHGAAMTTTHCRLCEKEMLFGSTGVDDFCHDCARKYRMCRQCGADLELKDRRKL